MSEYKSGAARTDGGPAFPESHPLHPTPSSGMTLRDYFAAKAMQGILTQPQDSGIDPCEEDFPLVAKWAYNFADAMIKARDA